MKLTAIFMATVEIPDAADYDEQGKALFRAMAAKILKLFGDGEASTIDCSRSIGCVGPITDDVRQFTLAVLDQLEAVSTPVLPAPLPAKKDNTCN